MAEIIPVILSKTSSDYHKKIKAVEPFTEWVQIDIVDGKFAPNKTIGPEVVAPIRIKNKLEIHLMVQFIEDWVDRFIKIQAVKRIIFPIETAFDPIGLIRHLKRHNVQVGVHLNPETPVKRLQNIISYLDQVLLLSVHPGFSGQHFVYGTLKEIEYVREMRPDIAIEVDGGIAPGTARRCVEFGANILNAGSFIFENDTIKGETYQERISNAISILKEDVEGVVPILEP